VGGGGGGGGGKKEWGSDDMHTLDARHVVAKASLPIYCVTCSAVITDAVRETTLRGPA